MNVLLAPSLVEIDPYPYAAAACLLLAVCALLWSILRAHRSFARAQFDHAELAAAFALVDEARFDLEAASCAKDAAIADAERALHDAQDAANRALEAEARRRRSEAEAAADREVMLARILDRLRTTVGDVVSTLSSSSRATLVSAASAQDVIDDSRTQMLRIAAATDQTVCGLSTVANATQELSQAGKEISDRVNQTLSLSARANEAAMRSSTLVERLEGSAEKIDRVVTFIESIADQTGLLALNAAIEAARAGAHGRGFAVVADEVRKLAEQSAGAIAEIGTTISTMRSSIVETVDAIGVIAGAVAEVNGAATHVAVAVEQQTGTTQSIAASVQQAADGTRDIRAAIEACAGSTERMTAAMARVRAEAEEVARDGAALQNRVDDIVVELVRGPADATPSLQ